MVWIVPVAATVPLHLIVCCFRSTGPKRLIDPAKKRSRHRVAARWYGSSVFLLRERTDLSVSHNVLSRYTLLQESDTPTASPLIG
jgi:hypothetical protein